MAKIVLEYFTANCPCIAGEGPNDSWSFTLYSLGTVVLKRSRSELTSWSYSFKIPQDTVNAIKSCLESNNTIIAALPEEIDTGCTGGMFKRFNLLGKKISTWFSISRRIDAEFREAISDLPLALQGLEACGKERCLDYRAGLLYDAVTYTILDIFSQACSYLHPYGLSLQWIRDSRAEYESCFLDWNIPNCFYSYGERMPVLEYVGEQSFALYGHGTVQLRINGTVYQLKIPQRAVDTICAAITANREFVNSLPDRPWMPDECGIGSRLICIGKKELNLAVEYENQDDADKRKTLIDLFVHICQGLKPYGLEVKYADNSLSCQWRIPHRPTGEVLLRSAKLYGASFTVYESGAVYLTNDSAVLEDRHCGRNSLYKHPSVHTVLYIPQNAVGKLHSIFAQYSAERSPTADPDSSCRHAVGLIYNSLGMETVLDIGYLYCEEKENGTLSGNPVKNALTGICRVLQPFGLSIKHERRHRWYLLDWRISNVPNLLFAPPEGFEAAPAEDTAEV